MTKYFARQFDTCVKILNVYAFFATILLKAIYAAEIQMCRQLSSRLCSPQLFEENPEG